MPSPRDTPTFHPGTSPTRASGARVRLRLTTLVIAIMLAATIAGGLWLSRDPEPHMLSRRSSLATVTEGPVVREGNHELRDVKLRALSGLEVELTIKRRTRDTNDHGRRPLAKIGRASCR